MQSKAGVLVGVVAVVLAIVAIIGPWWTLSISASFGAVSLTGHADYGLFGGTGSFQSGTTTGTNSTDYKNSPNVGSVFSLATIFTILGMLIGIGMIVIGAMSGRMSSTRRLGAILGILAFLVLLIGALYVMSALPGAVNTDVGSNPFGSGATFSGFWGTKAISYAGIASANVNWGAGWAWYVVLVAAIVFLVGGILMLRAPKPAMAPPMAMPPQAPMPPPSP